VSDDRSLVNAVLGVMTIGLMNVIVAALKQRYPRFRRWADGTPIVVFDGGNWITRHMNALHIQEQDVMAAARDKGMQRAHDIRYAIVERTVGSRSFRNPLNKAD
jgi:uncharacterized membrane protein YcaP (DUF421 family)